MFEAETVGLCLFRKLEWEVGWHSSPGVYAPYAVTEKNLLKYSEFLKVLSGCYLVFMNYIVGLTFTRKIN